MDACQTDLALSVLIPCYNTERFLDQALSSVRANDMKDMEIIVINDGSTDHSLDIMRKHASQDARLRIIDKVNEGYGASLNRAMDEAKGTYLAIFEPDDWVDPHMYDDLYALAQRYDYPDMVKSAFWCVHNPDTPKEFTTPCTYYQKLCITHQPFTLKEYPRILEHHPSIWSSLYKRSFLRENAIRFQEVKGAGWVDTPFNFRCWCLAQRVVYTDTPYYHYRSEVAGSSSATRNFSLPFERWHDMYAIASELNIQDTGILQGLYTIGFNYVEDAIRRGALKLCHDKAIQLIMSVYACMNPAIVRKMPYVSPEAKRRFVAMTSSYEVKYSKGQFYGALARDALAQLKCYGLGLVAQRACRFVAKRLKSH